jgi:hypothetical protein
LNRRGALLLGVFVVERHKCLDSKKANTKVLAVGNNVTTKNVFIDSRGGVILLLEFLNNGVVYNISGFVDSLDIGFLRSTNDDV